MSDFLFSSFVAADAKLFGVYVPWLGTGEGIQHEPHHTQTLAGKVGAVKNNWAHGYAVYCNAYCASFKQAFN